MFRVVVQLLDCYYPDYHGEPSPSTIRSNPTKRVIRRRHLGAMTKRPMVGGEEDDPRGRTATLREFFRAAVIACRLSRPH